MSADKMHYIVNNNLTFRNKKASQHMVVLSLLTPNPLYSIFHLDFPYEF